MNQLSDYKPLVLKLASRYHKHTSLNRTHEMDDLVSEGMIALWKCTKNYNPEHGANGSNDPVTFGQFASAAIENTLRGLMAHSKRKRRFNDTAVQSLSVQSDDEGVEELEIMDRATPSPFRVLQLKEVYNRIQALPNRERDVMLGILNDEDYADTGARMGVSKQRIEQLEKSAVSRIKKSIKVLVR